MTYNLNQQLINYEGQGLTIEKDGVDVPFTFKDVVREALNIVNPQDPTTPDQKAMAFEITVKAYANSEAAEFTAEEVAFILARIKANYPPITIGRSMEFFNQKSSDTASN